jgi:hypothetical protein
MRETDPCLEQKRGDDTVAVIPGKRVREGKSFDLCPGCPKRVLERTGIHIVADRAQEDKAVTVGVLGVEDILVQDQWRQIEKSLVLVGAEDALYTLSILDHEEAVKEWRC